MSIYSDVLCHSFPILEVFPMNDKNTQTLKQLNAKILNIKC